MKRLIGHTRRRRIVTGTVVLLGMAAVAAAFAVPTLFAGSHGLGASKGSGGVLAANGTVIVGSPVKVYGKYYSQWFVSNTIATDDGLDTMRVRSLTDTITSGSGVTPAGELIDKVEWYIRVPSSGGQSKCYKTLPPNPTDPNSHGTIADGAGTLANPWVNVVYCDLVSNEQLATKGYNVYTTTASDGASPTISDKANIIATDLCNGPGSSGCPTESEQGIPNAVSAQPAASAPLQKLDAVTTTDIHNAAHGVVTAVEVGTPVHDYVRVTPSPAGTPLPGTPPDTAPKADLFWFTNFDCVTPAADSTQLTLAPGPGSMWLENDATGFVKTPAAAGLFSFRANFLGTDAYNPALGACEPLRVVDARISITPNGVNRVGETHTFTVHVDVNDGSGWTNAADGTQITASKLSGPGTLGSNPCTTSGGTGSCTVTLVSSLTGVTSVSASTTVSVAGVSLTRTTNGQAGNSGPAVKRWVDAKISIAPNATNEIGQPHTFTVTLWKDSGDGNGFVKAAGEHVDVTLTNSNGATHTAPTGTCTDAGANTDANGQCTIIFTSPTPGQVTGHATSTLTVETKQITVATDGVAPNSGDAVKTFVDANIQITPNGVNRVGENHVFTAHVNFDAGNGQGFQNAPDGTQVSFTIDSGPGSFTTANPCVVAGGTGSCQITLTSNVTGVTVVSAHTTITVGGVSLTRHTNGQGANSAPATKRWVDAKISIAPNATNEVGQPHTFTVTLLKDVGNGAGFVPAAGEHVDVTLTDSNGAAHTAPTGTCTTAGANTDANGRCTITFSSPTAGQVTGHATSTLDVMGKSITVETNGQAGSSGDAVKTYVDANIQITPNGVNRVGQQHTFAAHVNVNTGNGSFVPAPAGTVVTFTIDSDTASSTPNPPTQCVTVGATGECTTTISSPTTGVTVVSAHTTLSVGGVLLTRHTNGVGANSNPATKRWVNAKIAITPTATNEVGHPHTFTVTLMKDTGDGNGFVAAAGEHVDVSLADSNGATNTVDAAASTCDDAGGNTDANGQCTMVINSATAGKVTAHASSTLSVMGSAAFTVETNGQGLNSGDAVKTYVDANIQITPNGVNRVGQQHTFTAHVNVNTGNGAGYVSAPDGTVVTFTIDSDTASSTPNPPTQCVTAGGTGNCTTTITSAVTGVTVVSAHTTLSVGGVTLTRNTNGAAGNSEPATKRWVNAKIQITPDATNRVGQPHTFYVTLMKDTGDGAGFVPAAGEDVDFSLTPSLGATLGPVTGTCTQAGANTDANGVCSITFSSNDTGKVTGHASSTLSVAGSAAFTVQTDGLILNSGDAVKTYVNAKISITPDATNEVGQPHTFTVTLQKDVGDGAGFVAAAGEHVDVTLTNANGASHTAPTGTCTNAGPNTDASGQCKITFSSPTAGTVTGHAKATLTLGPPPPATVTVETDHTGFNSGDAVKTFVDANIQITPNGVNRVGDTHTFTAHVNVNSGDGNGYVNAADGTQISFTIDSGPGSFTTANPCVTSGGTGNCQVSLVSNATGITVVSAHTSVLVGGQTLTRQTNGQNGSSGPAEKRWVNAKIAITPDATNEVGQPHTFTATLWKDIGDGNGFVAAPGEHVDVTLLDSNGAVHSVPTGTCTNAGPNTNASGQCTITFTSNFGGKVTGHAISTLSVEGKSISVATDGVAPNTGDAVKTFVDANIQITPNGVNRVGENHTFTAHVNVNDGSPAGFANAPAGTTISFTIDSGPGSFVGPSSCTTVGATGSCTATITSSTTGVTTVSAHTTVTLAGLSVTRHTNGAGANSLPATKRWVNAKIAIAPDAVNEVGQPHTFTATLWKDTGDGNGFVKAEGEHVTVTLTDANAVHSAPTGTCTNAGPNTDANGQCTITFTSPTAGTVTGHAAATLDVMGKSISVETDGAAPNSGDAVKTFVDAKISITPNGTNPVGATHVFTAHVEINKGDGAGFVDAPAGTQISFTKDSGPGSFTTANPCTVAAGGSCQISLVSNVPGTTVVSAHVTLSVLGVSLTRDTDSTHGSSGPATKLWADASVRTDIHNDDHVVITSAAVGTVVHDKVFVTRTQDTPQGVPNPTGNVVFARYANEGCTGEPAATQTVAIGADGTAESSDFTVTGPMSYKAHYVGDANYPARDGACEPLTVPVARISITPYGLNEVRSPHTFTVKVETSLDGTTWSPAGGITVTASKTAGVGSITGGTCESGPTDVNGECTVVVNSNVTGDITVNASADVAVSGVTLHIATNGLGAYEGHVKNVKRWVDAYIEITPPTAINPVGKTHTYTAHVFVDRGDGEGFVNAPNGTVVTFAFVGAHVGSFSGAANCTISNGAGTCTVDTTSSSAGVDTMQASTTLAVSWTDPDQVVHNVSLTRTTGQSAPGHANGGNAVKNWADATARTDIHNSSHSVVTSVTSGTSVHDKVFVAKAAGTPDAVPAPTGNVIFSRYANASCSGTAAATETLALGQDGTAETGSFTATSDMSYRAEYQGDANYPKRLGACEPLTVTTITTTTTTTTTTPPPTIDLAVTKTDSPDPVTLGGNVTYTMVVRNNGPSVATGVKVADPIPANTTFVSVTTTKGTCTGSATIVNCDLGTMAVGEQITITLVVKPTQAVTINNCVTVVGNEAETNTANNQACAPTTVNTPFKPPVVKPKICNRVTAAPKQLTATKLSTLRLLVTHSRNPVKGAKVAVRGAGVVKVSNKTNKQGRVDMKVRPAKPGIMLVSTPGGKGCGDRVGVIPIFKPPVTG